MGLLGLRQREAAGDVHPHPSGGDLGDARNRLDGVLRDVIFKGPYLDCLVALANRRELTVSAPPETPGLVRGAAVWIGWAPEAAAAFRVSEP